MMDGHRIEKPKPDPACRFTVGQDSSGHWIVTDALGLSGGLFVSEAAAMHFAREESGYNPAEIQLAEIPDLTIECLFRH